MNTIKTWLAAHSITSKTAAAAWLFITGLYATSAPFHDFVWKMYTDMPKAVHEIIAAVIIPGLMFYKAEKAGVTSTQTTTTTTITPPPAAPPAAPLPPPPAPPTPPKP